MANKGEPTSYGDVLRELERRLREPAPGLLQVLTGPRQVGKTRLLGEIEAGFEGRARYVAADAAAASLPGWWEAQWAEAERRAVNRPPAVLLIDEIQYVSDWGRRLKASHDAIRRRRVPLHVVVSGSSSLSLGRGARETMAGRFERLRLLHWSAGEIARVFSMDPREAVETAVRQGTYPGATGFLEDRDRWRAYLRDAIVEPAIGKDIMALEVIRKPALLRQLFMIAAGHPAEIVTLQKLRGRLEESGALTTLAHYLDVLEQASLVAGLEKHSEHAVRRRRAPPKLVVLNPGIVGALSDEDEPSPARFGRWVENACLAHAWNSGQTVKYWRAEPYEVDMVTTGSWGDWAVEVKTGRYSVRDLAGLLEFCRRFPKFSPLVLADCEDEATARDAGLPCRSWASFLLGGPPDWPLLA